MIKRYLAIISVMTVLCLTGGCFGERSILSSVEDVVNPATGESAQPNLMVGPKGDVYLSWIEVDKVGKSSLKFASKTKEGWSEAKPIISSDELYINWADFPSLYELADGTLAAHWLATVPDRGGYNVSVAFSRDRGATWGMPVTPHRDGTQAEHGFVSLAPSTDGLAVLWLDGRKLESGSDDVALMSTSITVDGKPGAESEIDDRVCECCQPASIARSGGGMLTVYRDRSKDEIRDIVISQFDGKAWSPPKTVFDDHWMITACPIQGPAISASGDHVAVAWFTGANNKPKVQLALSSDGGKTFGAPTQIDEGEPVGRVDVASLDTGGAIVTWIEHTDRGGEIRARQVGSNGKAFDAITVGKASLGNASGFPRVERSGDTIIFAWTDTTDGRIRTAVSE